MEKAHEMDKAHEIVSRVHAAKGNADEADVLIREYQPFIKKETYKALGHLPIEGKDDELGIAMFAFYEAIESYESTKGAFLPFAALLIRRKIVDWQRTQRRHGKTLSLDSPPPGREDGTLAEGIPDTTDAFAFSAERNATQQEIRELTLQLRQYGLTLADVAENSPKQQRSLKACQQALAYARENPGIIDLLLKTGKLPMNELTAGSGVPRKTLERHRKYLMTLLIIHSNGYELIRGHLKQVFPQTKRGTGT
jgi:RNA polymerase sigma factor